MVDGKTPNGDAVNCDLVWREISNYVEGDVDAATRAAMDEHFRTCKRCASVLAGMRNVISLYSDERMIEAPSGFGRRLERRIAINARASRKRWSTWSAWLVPVAAMALISGGLEIASSLTNPHPMQSAHAQPAHDIPPDLLVVVSADAKVFHVPGCDFIHNKDKERTLTAREAIQQGYIPCLRCMRRYLNTAGVGRTAIGSWADDVDAEQEEEYGGGGQ